MTQPAAEPLSNPDAMEVAPGTEHEVLEGWIPPMATEEETREALEQAFDYRGDVTITLKTGVRIEGYIFDRRPAPALHRAIVRIMPKDTSERVSIPYSEIAGLAFTGRDSAAGKSWEAWVQRYWEKKAAGEKNIGIQAEALD
ncbi:MAG: hypothetical protein ACYCO5_15995 [Acidobacteriaceae bacterium]